MRGKEHCADREGGKKRGLGYGSGLGPGFHDAFLLQKHSLMVWQEKENPPSFRPLAEETKGPKTLRGTTLLRPRDRGRTYPGYHHIPAQ